MNKSLWISAVLIFISMIIGWLIMWFFGVLLSVPIAVIVTIIVKNRYQLEYDELMQVDKDEVKEIQKIKKEMNIVEQLEKVLKNTK